MLVVAQGISAAVGAVGLWRARRPIGEIIRVLTDA